jgi:hypothetical protein
MFLASMFICCGSALVSKDKAEASDYSRRGWHLPGDPVDAPSISEQRMVAVAVPAGVFFGLAVASLGLGLQAQNRVAPVGSVVVCVVAVLFWIVQLVFAVGVIKSIVAVLATLVASGLFAVLLPLSIAALREMRRNPPPVGHEILPADYKVPYSHMHQDPPEVRLARELEQRRERLAVQQKELEMLEAKLRRTVSQESDQKPNVGEDNS